MVEQPVRHSGSICPFFRTCGRINCRGYRMGGPGHSRVQPAIAGLRAEVTFIPGQKRSDDDPAPYDPAGYGSHKSRAASRGLQDRNSGNYAKSHYMTRSARFSGPGSIGIWRTGDCKMKSFCISFGEENGSCRFSAADYGIASVSASATQRETVYRTQDIAAGIVSASP